MVALASVGNPPVAVNGKPIFPAGKPPRASWWLCSARPICLRLFWHLVRAAASRTFWTAGRSRPIRMAMIAITTSNSISVKPRRRGMSGTGQPPGRGLGSSDTLDVAGAGIQCNLLLDLSRSALAFCCTHETEGVQRRHPPATAELLRDGAARQPDRRRGRTGPGAPDRLEAGPRPGTGVRHQARRAARPRLPADRGRRGPPPPDRA